MGGESKSSQNTQTTQQQHQDQTQQQQQTQEQQQSQLQAAFQQQQQNQSGQTGPWDQTLPALQGILAGINAGIPSYQPTANENNSFNQLVSNAQNLPNFAPQVTDLAKGYIGGDPNSFLRNALNQYNQQLGGLANQNNDPRQTPGIAALLDTIRSDVGNSVNGLFAGAGRDLSGYHTQTLARGLAQGEAAPLLAQYNQNVAAQTGAAGNLYNAAGLTDAALTGNRKTGLEFANLIPGLQNAGPMGVLAAESMRRQLPLENLGMLANLTVPIAGLGSQFSNVGNSNTSSLASAIANATGTANMTGSGTSNMTGSGTSNTQGTQQMSGAQQFATIAGGAGGLFRSFWPGGVGTIFSDRRLKEDIKQVGELFDGTPVYRFRYLNDPTVHIGLMADEVEQYAPEAVGEYAGYKYVDYALATNRALEA